jgi:hypothetical protein
MTQKRSMQLMLIGLWLLLGKPTFAVDSEALGEELKKGQHQSETQKPAPKKQAADKPISTQQTS